ncbi:MAG: mechanosensitive ion channel [candidate division NC10 bacterium]|nr:mechanosensitive ion channel [candidate division NC10 bacterium]
MEEFFVAFGGYEEHILYAVLGVAAELLVAVVIYLWVRRFLRAWAERTGRSVDKKIVAISEYFLLPIIALAGLFLLFQATPLFPKGMRATGEKVLIGTMAVLGLWLVGRLALLFLERMGEYHEIARVLARQQRSPILAAISATIFYAVLVHLMAPEKPAWLVVPKILIIVTFSWILFRGVASAAHMVRKTYVERLEHIDEARARSFETLVGVSRQVANSIVVLLATVAVLSQFEFFDTLARSLLASAGIAGLVLGLAAQRTLGNAFAGVQLALTQPVSLGDSVVFDGEWGWIEEISLTYVVIRIWDLRRLVVPITYLLDRPIQNWTKTSPDLIGTVYIYTDYRIDVEAVRQELGRILETTNLWNRKVPPVLQTTECRHDTVELRALCSASSAPVAWDLRCLVRERLLTYIQQMDNGRFLPRTRVEFERQAIESA